MGYGIHTEEVERTEKDYTCSICTLGNDTHAWYMKFLANCNLVEYMLAAAPGIQLIELGAYGFEWFLFNRYKLGIPDELDKLGFLAMARAFAMALMDTAAKIREEKI